MLSLKLSTNTKMNLIYLSNIQYVKSSDNIRFVPYFNCQNHMKNKKIFLKLNIMCPTSIILVLCPIRIGHGTRILNSFFFSILSQHSNPISSI